MATFHYHYDPLDRLIQTAGIQRFYNQSRMTTEIKGTQRYSVFQQDGRLLAQQRRDRTKDECHLLGTDLQQSVLHAVGADKHHSMAYNAYGHRPVENGLISLLGFNGERADPVTGHYLLGNGYRAFNPVLMRFNSPDSWSPFGRGGINAYVYCLNDPINRRDTDGRVSFKIVVLLVKAAGRFRRRLSPVRQLVKPSLENLPDVPMKKILSMLSGTTLSDLSIASKTMHARVAGNQSVLRGVSSLERLRNISLGRVQGFLPSQVNSNSEYVSRIYSRSSNTAADFRLQVDFEEARADANLLYLRGVEARKKKLKVAQKKIRYGEDVQSDTSYDSDDSYR